jgi:uncharacterized membrane protein (DUF4010 family)
MPLLTTQKLGLLIGLSFFFGLAFEGFYWNSARSRPGGIRTFPLISLCGAILLALEPKFAAAFCVGLLVLAVWLYPYYRAEVTNEGPRGESADGIMVPLCNLVAYLLGPVTLLQPAWLSIGLTVVAVLLLRARDRLHALARKVPAQEIITLAQFLVLAGVILPLLPKEPVTTLSPITPFQVWLAVVVVSSLSYGSYLLQKLLPTGRSLFLTSLLGGLYSSTATTIVLARHLKEDPANQHELQSGIVLATALMYLRVGVVIAIFNLALALRLALPLAGLSSVGVVAAALCLRLGKRAKDGKKTSAPVSGNPLELRAAAIFAVMFVVISISSTWVEKKFGHAGVYWLASIVGVTDIDPFVLSVAQGGVSGLDLTGAAVAVLLAASSNNALKAIYAVGFAGWRRSVGIVASLLLLTALGVAIAAWVAVGAG